MKKTIFLLIVSVFVTGVSCAQIGDDVVLQPTHVIGRSIDANGEITKELVSDFIYHEDGKLMRYEFPEYALTGNFYYSDDFLTQESVFHQGGYPSYYETANYSYENGRIKTKEHLMDQMGISQYWQYDYYDDGRLKSKERKDELDDDYHMHWLYDYEDAGKTVIRSYWTSWASQGMLLRERSTSQFDDDYVLLTSLTESFNTTGELTSTKKTSYTYTPSGMTEMATTQTLQGGEWVNASFVHYAYDDADRLTVRVNGNWDAELGEWVEAKKILFDLSEEEQKYTVSFYKKVNGEWQWDVFNNQTILFGSEMEVQQRMIGYMVYEAYHEFGYVNQIEFTLAETHRPNYMVTDENHLLSCGVYPNPGHDYLRVEALAENAVVRFYDLQGQLLLSKPFDFAVEINAKDWPAGIYIWEISRGNQKIASGKWMKE